MRGVGESAFHNLFPVGYRQLAKDHLDIAEDNQGSEKWGRIFPDKAKSHGQFGAKTTYKIDKQRDRQTDRKIGNIIPGQSQISWTLIFKLKILSEI